MSLISYSNLIYKLTLINLLLNLNDFLVDLVDYQFKEKLLGDMDYKYHLFPHNKEGKKKYI